MCAFRRCWMGGETALQVALALLCVLLSALTWLLLLGGVSAGA